MFVQNKKKKKKIIMNFFMEEDFNKYILFIAPEGNSTV
jgi:hypothetical protein